MIYVHQSAVFSSPSAVPGIAATSEIVNVYGAIVAAIAFLSGIINSIVPKSSFFVFSAAPPGTLIALSPGSSANI